MINISASLVKDYITCSKKVDFRRGRPETAIQTPDMFAGTIVHKIIEDDTDNYEKFIDALELDYSRKNKIKICMSNYQVNYKMLTSNKDEIEKYFKYSFSKGVNIVGKFDRILPDGVVIDWKSNVSVPKTLDNDIQFLMYHEAYKQIYNKEPHSVFGIFLLKNKMIRYNHNEFFRTVVYHDIIPSIISAIKKGDFSREGIFKGICDNCSYRSICY
jgi:CRISPR/Cas system-associated exonuclease Cas4 (RecB family)